MKINTIKTTLGSFAILSALVMAPAAFAQTATTTATVRINSDGIVHVRNAEVTSVTGNLINAITRFKTMVTTWAFTTNASTTIAANNSATASTSDIHVGDHINVAGALTSFGTTLSANVSKVVDTTSFTLRAKSGTVQSINSSNGTFVLKAGDKLVTVQTNASTTYTVRATATSTIATTTFAGLAVNSRVEVAGMLSANGTVLTATKVMILPIKPIKVEVGKENHDNNGKSDESHGLHKGWLKNGKHLGTLKANLGLGLGLGDR